VGKYGIKWGSKKREIGKSPYILAAPTTDLFVKLQLIQAVYIVPGYANKGDKLASTLQNASYRTYIFILDQISGEYRGNIENMGRLDTYPGTYCSVTR
jgi:hypothetical protein